MTVKRLFNSPKFVGLLVVGAIFFVIINLAPLWTETPARNDFVPAVGFAEVPPSTATGEGLLDSTDQNGSAAAHSPPPTAVPNIGWQLQPARNPFRFENRVSGHKHSLDNTLSATELAE